MTKTLLGKTLERNIVPIEVGKQGMINVRHIVLHTAKTKKKRLKPIKQHRSRNRLKSLPNP